MLRLLVAFVASLLSLPVTGTTSADQEPLLAGFGYPDSAAAEQKHIAIIGAGIGGASTAFELHERNRNSHHQKITIFERESTVGGRIQSVYLYPGEGGRKIIEEGATGFFTDDGCLTSSMQDVGLRPPDPGPPELDRYKARWPDDNVRTEVKCNAESKSWRDFLQRRYKFGPSWSVFHSAVRSAVEQWDSFAGPRRPSNNMTKEFDRVGMPELLYGSSDAYFRNLTISSELESKFIQPCTRARAAQNLSAVSALSALIAAGKSSTTYVDGGNSRLVERMIRLSEADLELGSIVTAITPGSSRRYRLSISQSASNEIRHVEFDIVILATPLETSEIDLSFFNMHTQASPTPRIDTHVTHFSSEFPISSNLSILPLDISIHGTWTLTTSTAAEDPNILNLQRSTACFTRYCLPGDECDECDADDRLYRIQSRHYLTDDDLVRMIDREPKEDKKLSDYGIGFVSRRAWPRSYPQVIQDHLHFVDEIEIGPDLYYVNGAESAINSMEMSCRMGRTVALKVDIKRSPFRM